MVISHDLRPGDLGRVTELHGQVYAREYGFDHTFEAYVASTLAEFGLGLRPGRDRLWLADVLHASARCSRTTSVQKRSDVGHWRRIPTGRHSRVRWP